MSDENEFNVLEAILSGAPVPVVIGDETWHLHQPKPIEMDKMRRVQTLAHDSVIAGYRAAGLDKEPVSAEMTELRRLYDEAQEVAYVEAMKAGDQDAARAALEENTTLNWPTNLAEERAREDARRATARWIIDNLLDGDREAFRRATAPDPLNHSAVVAAVQRMLALINHDPNSNGRQV